MGGGGSAREEDNEGKERMKSRRDQEGKGERESIARIAGLYKNQKLGEGTQG